MKLFVVWFSKCKKQQQHLQFFSLPSTKTQDIKNSLKQTSEYEETKNFWCTLKENNEFRTMQND